MLAYVFKGLIVASLFLGSKLHAQFAPCVGQPGTTAMYKDSSAFIDWANACIITRGFQDISDNSLGYANVGDETMALGQAGSNGVVSLGDGGTAIVQFNFPISDAPGPDLAVFENGFDDTFLELAFVEVSSDGTNFFRFPATSNTDTTTQTTSFGPTNATSIHNLAGKYRGLYGTPFDIADIPANALLNKAAITHVKIIDVVGSIQNQYCSRDQYNHKVNDPWPTGFGSSGFDLDAVGVIHNQTNVGIKEANDDIFNVVIYPIPARDQLNISLKENETYNISVINSLSEIIMRSTSQSNICKLNIETLNAGVYFISIENKNKKVVKKFIKSEF